MATDYGSLPPNKVRRRDREVVDDAWIKAYLHEAPSGCLASVWQGQPFINSNLFVYDEEAHGLYLHTGRVGRTAAIVGASGRTDGKGAQVCFTAFSMGRLLPAAEALEFSVEYQGVTVFGDAHIVTDRDEARRALERLLRKYAPHLRPVEDYRPVTDDELARTAVYRVEITSWSGKKKEAAADFPGAYVYGQWKPDRRR